MWALLGQAATDPSGQLVAIYGPAGAFIAFLLWAYQRESRRADQAQEKLVEITKIVSELGAETNATLRESTSAIEALTSEVRRMGEPRE